MTTTTKQKKTTAGKARQPSAKKQAVKKPKPAAEDAAAHSKRISSAAHAEATRALLADLERDAAKQEAAAGARRAKKQKGAAAKVGATKAAKPDAADAPKASSAKAAKPAAPRPSKAEKPPKRTSLLDAAASVLREAKAPLGARAIVELVAERGLWAPTKGGKTPHATLYAAMTREIAKKGDASRFAKAERGLFTAAASAGKGA